MRFHSSSASGNPARDRTWPAPDRTVVPAPAPGGTPAGAGISTGAISGANNTLGLNAGTGGTISGVGRYLKERRPEVRIVLADPEGSILSGDAPRGYKVEGIGQDYFPEAKTGPLAAG